MALSHIYCKKLKIQFIRFRHRFGIRLTVFMPTPGHAPLKSGLFLLNLDRSDTHIHNIEAKRCKVNNDSATYLWHCRLGHIGVNRMKKLHEDGLLESLDYESFDTSEPCPMGKMTKTPFSGTMERANDLL